MSRVDAPVPAPIPDVAVPDFVSGRTFLFFPGHLLESRLLKAAKAEANAKRPPTAARPGLFTISRFRGE